jgi:hypothetical protein
MTVKVPKTFIAYWLGLMLGLMLAAPIALTAAGLRFAGVIFVVVILILAVMAFMWEWGQ